MQVDPQLIDAAAWLGKGVDFLVIPCNAAHVGLAEIHDAAGCPVLSMIDAALEEVARRGWRRVGVLGFRTAPPVYTEPLRQRGIACETIDAARQARLDAGIQALMEGREGAAEADAARRRWRRYARPRWTALCSAARRSRSFSARRRSPRTSSAPWRSWPRPRCGSRSATPRRSEHSPGLERAGDAGGFEEDVMHALRGHAVADGMERADPTAEGWYR